MGVAHEEERPVHAAQAGQRLGDDDLRLQVGPLSVRRRNPHAKATHQTQHLTDEQQDWIRGRRQLEQHLEVEKGGETEHLQVTG